MNKALGRLGSIPDRPIRRFEMRKVLLFVCTIIFMCMTIPGVCFAEHMGTDVAEFSNAATSSTATASTSQFALDGYVDRVSIKFRTNNIAVSVRISSSNEYSSLEQTIYENTNGVSTNLTVYPRVKADDIEGTEVTEYIRIPLIKDKIKYEVWSASATNQDVTFLFYYHGIH